MEHLTKEQIANYRAGTLDNLEDYAVVEEHLAACPQCQELFQKVADAGTMETGAGRGRVSHPEDDIILRYAQGADKVSPLEREHIAQCARCLADATSLRKYLETQTLTPLPLPPQNGNNRNVSKDERIYVPGGMAALRMRWTALALCGAIAAAGIVWFGNHAALERVTAERNRLQKQLAAGIHTGDNGSQSSPFFLAGDMPEQRLSQFKSKSVSMGEADVAVVLIRPASTLVSSLRPILKWKLQKRLPGAVKYEITILNTQTNKDQPLYCYLRGDENLSTPKKPIFTPSEVEKQIPDGWLQPATKYRWSVEVQDANGIALGSSAPDKETFFTTPTAKELGRLGQIYAQLGDLDDAEAALAIDTQSAASRALLAKVRKKRAELK